MLCQKDFVNDMEACIAMFDDDMQWNKLPVVNYTSSDELYHGQLVVFRGLVQDMFNPVLYLAKYEVKNKQTGETEIRSGKYMDSTECKVNEELVFQSDTQEYGERKPVYCVSVPGCNDWVDRLLSENNSDVIKTLKGKESHSVTKQMETSEKKRCFDNDDDKNDNRMEEGESSESRETNSNKRLCTANNRACEGTSLENSKSHNLNLPISKRSDVITYPALLANIYDETFKLSLNQVIEVAGFLLCDPTAESEIMPIEVELPPLSVVPHMHVVAVRKLTNYNPQLTHCKLAAQANFDEVVRCAETTRAELHSTLRKLLLGDTLAADYLIVNLISTIFQRKDALVLGKYALNISNIPSNVDYAKLLYTFLTNIVTSSHYLPMTIDHLNSINLVPKKNYETGRLESGLLQLADGTHLVLDETKMQPGKLLDKGVRNMQALATVINFQKLDYDFQYYPVEFPTDIRILILSEGKSMLSCDCQVPLDYSETSTEYIEELFSEAGRFLERESLAEQIRVYLSIVARLVYKFSEDVETQITEDFVRMRRDQAKTSAQDLHHLLVLARLFSLSRGSEMLTKETWQIVQEMEQHRKMRVERR